MGNTTSHYDEYSYITNDYELVIRSSKHLEYLLHTELQAHGQGLHEKISSVEKSLSPELVRNMRYLATIRNKLVHEHNFDRIPERETFVAKFNKSRVELEDLIKERRRARNGIAKSSETGCIMC
jgi:hypothetical protein